MGWPRIFAALIAVFGRFFAWLRARREDKAVRASLAVEMRSLLNVSIDTHDILTSMKFTMGQTIVAAAEPPRPTVICDSEQDWTTETRTRGRRDRVLLHSRMGKDLREHPWKRL